MIVRSWGILYFMGKFVATVMLLTAFVLADAFSFSYADPVNDLRITRIEAELERLRLHGYASPVRASEELRAAAEGLNGSEPLDLRMRYHAKLAELGLAGREDALAKIAAEGLLRLAADENCELCRAHALMLEARQGLIDNQLDVVESLLDQAEVLAADNPRLRLDLLRTRVDYQEAGSKLTVALATALDAIRLADSMGSVADRVRLLNQVARLNARLGNYDRALVTLREGQSLASSIGFIDAEANLYLDEGYIHALMGDREKQFAALTQALSIAEANSGLSDVQVITLSNISDYYLNAEQYPRALEYADRAAALAESIGSVEGQIVAMANQGLAVVGMGDVAAGVKQLEQAASIARQQDYVIYEVGLAAELARVLEEDGQYKKALETMHAVAELNERITAQEREKAVLELQEKYDNERKSREIERLSSQAELKKAELDVRSSRQRLWGAIAVALGLAAFLMAQWLRSARQANRRLRKDNASLTEQTVVDELTGAFNRRYFNTLVEQAAASAYRRPEMRATQSDTGIIVLDIDHFKTVNDTYGHATGDEVLIELVQRLRSLLRDADAVVRWGGEEFVVVLPGTHAAGVQTLAGRILFAIASRPFSTSAGAIDVTVSLGCVAFPALSDVHWEDAMVLADAAMYEAKQTGRNRAICVQRMDKSATLDGSHDNLANAHKEGRIVMATVSGNPTDALPH